MDKKRIQVYTDESLKRRIELAAAKANIPVTAYCLQAILEQLAEDDLLEAEQIAISFMVPKPDDTLILDLRTLREKILARRNGKMIELDILEQVRDERDYELTGLH